MLVMLFHCLQSIQSNRGRTIFGHSDVGMPHIQVLLGLFLGRVRTTLTKHSVTCPHVNLLLNASTLMLAVFLRDPFSGSC